MADVIFVALTLGFFGLCVLFVRACDRIIGPEPSVEHLEQDPAAPVGVGDPDHAPDGHRP